QCSRTPAIACPALSGELCLAISESACDRDNPSPRRNTILRVSPGCSITRTCMAAHGSMPAPNSPVRLSSPSADGLAIEPLRPRNERRLPVAEIKRSLQAAKQTRPENVVLYGYQASTAL